jgi:hypothetical protein
MRGHDGRFLDAAARSTGGAMPTDRDIEDTDRADDNDVTIPGLIQRLTKAGRILTRVHNRLDAINEVGANPPDDQKPTYDAAVITIKNEAAAIGVVADELLARSR